MWIIHRTFFNQDIIKEYSVVSIQINLFSRGPDRAIQLR